MTPNGNAVFEHVDGCFAIEQLGGERMERLIIVLRDVPIGGDLETARLRRCRGERLAVHDEADGERMSSGVDAVDGESMLSQPLFHRAYRTDRQAIAAVQAMILLYA